MTGFTSVLRAEALKGRHAAPRKIALVAPLPFCAMGALAGGVLGGGGAGGSGFATYGWNWWYVLMLPVCVALICANVANADAKQRLRSVLGLPCPLAHVWWAKVLYVLALVLAANAVVAACGVAVRLVGGGVPHVAASLLAVPLLTVTVSWMVPVSLALTMRLGTLAGIALPLLLQLAVGISFSTSDVWWALPMAVGMRIVTPVIGVAPSGIPLAAGDAMGAVDGAWAAGLAVAVAAGAVLAVAGGHWFARQEAA